MWASSATASCQVTALPITPRGTDDPGYSCDSDPVPARLPSSPELMSPAFRTAPRRGASSSQNENVVPLWSHETSAMDLSGLRHLLETEYMRLPADVDSALQQVERMRAYLEQMKAAEGVAK
jgi:hypothetical protein